MAARLFNASAVLGTLLLAVGCASAPAGRAAKVIHSVPSTTVSANGTVAQSPEVVTPLVDRQVILFVADPMCGVLEPKRVDMADSSPTEAIRVLLRTSALATLPLSEPEVTVEDRSARVDLRLRQGTRRSLQRLSPCEQLALLGGIRETLRGNRRWGISHVIFTERGSLLAI